jgi:hypothetical protein
METEEPGFPGMREVTLVPSNYQEYYSEASMEELNISHVLDVFKVT